MLDKSVGRGGTTDHVALGRAVRELRKRRGLTQIVVSYDAGVHDAYVGQVERGIVNPTFGMLLRIVRTLDFTFEELVKAYDRHLAEIDVSAGADVPRCPTPEARAYARQLAEKERVKNWAAIRRGRMR